jgi:hypothetical protein
MPSPRRSTSTTSTTACPSSGHHRQPTPVLWARWRRGSRRLAVERWGRAQTPVPPCGAARIGLRVAALTIRSRLESHSPQLDDRGPGLSPTRRPRTGTWCSVEASTLHSHPMRRTQRYKKPPSRQNGFYGRGEGDHTTGGHGNEINEVRRITAYLFCQRLVSHTEVCVPNSSPPALGIHHDRASQKTTTE